MSCRAAVALALLAPLGAGVQAAGAATVSTPERCYSSREPVDYVGTEFRPGAKFTVFLAGRTGVGHRGLEVAGERTFTLTVTDGQRRATTRFRSTKFGADYRPDRGDPATLRVRFYAFDFGARRTVYLHYIRPNGRHRLTIKLGPTGGPCGTMVSGLRRIFPFPAAPGSWRLQFDAVAKFDATPPRPFVRLVVPVLRNR